MGSVQLLVLGVFGEYLGRMYMEAKQRPLFIIAEVRRHPISLDARLSDEAAAAATSTEPHEGLRVTG
jgi:dolichol-phosphate mannosyltransferase